MGAHHARKISRCLGEDKPTSLRRPPKREGDAMTIQVRLNDNGQPPDKMAPKMSTSMFQMLVSTRLCRTAALPLWMEIAPMQLNHRLIDTCLL